MEYLNEQEAANIINETAEAKAHDALVEALAPTLLRQVPQHVRYTLSFEGYSDEAVAAVVGNGELNVTIIGKNERGKAVALMVTVFGRTSDGEPIPPEKLTASQYLIGTVTPDTAQDSVNRRAGPFKPTAKFAARLAAAQARIDNRGKIAGVEIKPPSAEEIAAAKAAAKPKARKAGTVE